MNTGDLKQDIGDLAYGSEILFLEGIFAYLRIKDFSNLRLKFFLEIITSFGYNFCCFFPIKFEYNSQTVV